MVNTNSRELLVAQMYDLRLVRLNAKKKLTDRVKVLKEDKTISEEYREQLIELAQEEYKKTIRGVDTSAVELVQNLKEHANKPLNIAEMTDTITYIETMHKANKLNTMELADILGKYRGQEKALDYLLAVCINNGIDTSIFDSLMFARQKDKGNDFDRGSSLDDYFSGFANSIISDNEYSFMYAMNTTSEKFGVDSTGIKAKASYDEFVANNNVSDNQYTYTDGQGGMLF